MKFVVQYNLMNEDSLEKIKTALVQSNIPHVFVGVIPFSREITCNESLDGIDFLPYGSTSLTVEAKRLNWTGIYFDPDTFRTDQWLLNRDDMLNISKALTISEAMKFLETVDPESIWFTRPTEDLKSYSGQLIEAKECLDWLKSAIECASSDNAQLNENTQIILSEPKTILKEWRWFIVNGKIIDGSIYRVDCELKKIHEDNSTKIAAAQEFANKWLPHKNCVMDLALIESENGLEFKVIEFNTINSSGFYDHDVAKIINALWEDFVS